MIVKTGANYQAEGGYIEFAMGDNTAILNGVAVPSVVYSDSIKVTGLQRISITRRGIAGGVRCITYLEYTSTTGEKYYDYYSQQLNVDEPTNVTLPTGFGSAFYTPDGYHPKLVEGSENVKIVKSTANRYYLIALGESPNAVIELEANE